jgi:phosphotriesterase-related protein
MSLVASYRGPLDPGDLGLTLLHEHLFVRDPELEWNGAAPEWDRAAAVERAVAGLVALHGLGVRTVVDLTVPGLGRDVRTVAEVAERVPIRLVAATGWYTRGWLPLHFALRGPGLTVDTEDELVELFLGDLTRGIAGTAIRAAVIKVTTDEAGITPDIARILRAAAAAQAGSGVPIVTHAHAPSRNGVEQLAFLRRCGVDPERVVIGHAGDTTDLGYLRAIMDTGATAGMDRFGMAHLVSDAARTRTVAELVRLGYADRMILSHDAAFYSHVTPPSWRAVHAPDWQMETIPRSILGDLGRAGVSDADLHQLMVINPRRLLEPAGTPGAHEAGGLDP